MAPTGSLCGTLRVGLAFANAKTDRAAKGPHLSNVAVIKPRLLSTGIEGRGFRVIVRAKDLHDLRVAEPVALRPLDRIAIHIVEEDPFGFLGGPGLDDNFGILAGITGQ